MTLIGKPIISEVESTVRLTAYSIVYSAINTAARSEVYSSVNRRVSSVVDWRLHPVIHSKIYMAIVSY